MKRYLSAILALAIILTLTACAAPAAGSESEASPVPSSISEPEPVSEPEPDPEPKEVTLTGVVTEITDSLVFLTKEDGSQTAFQASAIEGYEVQAGDTITIQYTDDGKNLTVNAVEVATAEPEEPVEETPAPQPTQTAPAASSQAPASQSPAPSQTSGTIHQVTGVVDKVTSTTMTLTFPLWSEDIIVNIESIKGLEVLERDMVRVKYQESSSGNVAISVEVLWSWGNGESSGGAYDDDDDWDDTPSSRPGSSKTDGPPKGAGDVYEAIDLINDEREKAGLDRLEIDSDLMEMAAVRAKEISEDYEGMGIKHYRPNGEYFSNILEEYNYECTRREENVDASQATAARTVSRWMNSSVHKDNILNEKITKIGLGYYYDSNSDWKHHWVMLAANPK